MNKLILVLLFLFFLSFLFTYPILAIGIGLAIWGYFEWRVNKKLNVISKVPIAIMIAGVVIAFSGIGTLETSSNDKAQETNTSSIVNSDETTNLEDDNDKGQDESKTETVEKEKVNENVEKANEEQIANEEAEKVEDENKAEQEEKAKEKQEQNQIQSLGLVAATVARVIDGDTFELTDGSKVRLIGVNTPESTTRTEEYGKEASNYSKSKLEGKQVYLQKDVSETDRYGRLLRLVWLEVPSNLMDEKEIRTKMFNADLVLNGYAEPSTYPPDVTYAEYFRKFAREARENEIGLWAYGPEGTTKGDLDSKETASNNSSNKSDSSKTESNSSNDKNSSSTSSKRENFKNCTELRKVYPDGVPSDHPAYQAKMDRDKDGWACER